VFVPVFYVVKKDSDLYSPFLISCNQRADVVPLGLADQLWSCIAGYMQNVCSNIFLKNTFRNLVVIGMNSLKPVQTANGSM